MPFAFLKKYSQFTLSFYLLFFSCVTHAQPSNHPNELKPPQTSVGENPQDSPVHASPHPGQPQPDTTAPASTISPAISTPNTKPPEKTLHAVNSSALSPNPDKTVLPGSEKKLPAWKLVTFPGGGLLVWRFKLAAGGYEFVAQTLDAVGNLGKKVTLVQSHLNGEIEDFSLDSDGHRIWLIAPLIPPPNPIVSPLPSSSVTSTTLDSNTTGQNGNGPLASAVINPPTKLLLLAFSTEGRLLFQPQVPPTLELLAQDKNSYQIHAISKNRALLVGPTKDKTCSVKNNPQKEQCPGYQTFLVSSEGKLKSLSKTYHSVPRGEFLLYPLLPVHDCVYVFSQVKRDLTQPKTQLICAPGEKNPPPQVFPGISPFEVSQTGNRRTLYQTPEGQVLVEEQLIQNEEEAKTCPAVMSKTLMPGAANTVGASTDGQETKYCPKLRIISYFSSQSSLSSSVAAPTVEKINQEKTKNLKDSENPEKTGIPELPQKPNATENKQEKEIVKNEKEKEVEKAKKWFSLVSEKEICVAGKPIHEMVYEEGKIQIPLIQGFTGKAMLQLHDNRRVYRRICLPSGELSLEELISWKKPATSPQKK